MQTLNYTYAAKRPTEGEDVIAEQISLAHRYYNRLIEIHRARRDECEAMRQGKFPMLAELEGNIAAAELRMAQLRDGVRQRNAELRRKNPQQTDKQAIAEVKEQLKGLRQERKSLRLAIQSDAELQSGLAAIYAKSAQQQRDARASCGVYFGCYLRIESAVESAVKKTKFGPPRFKRWTGDGCAGAQIQKGMSVQELTLGLDNRLRLESVLARGKHKSPLALFAVRVRSTEKGKPVWARLPVYYHRDLPADAQIMWATILRVAGAPRRQSDGTWRPFFEWSLQLAIRTNAEHPRADCGTCGVDMGWRLMEDGSLRVAYVVGDDGTEESLTFSPRNLDRWSKARSLQAIRDKNFDGMKAALIDWLSNSGSVPEWLAEQARTLPQWKSHGRLCWLFEHWQRFEGDETVYAELKAWREREAHLLDYERGLTRGAIRWRKRFYEQFAARLREKYRTIAVEDCDWKTLGKRAAAESDVGDGGARTYMRVASVGQLRQCLKSAGAVMVDAKDTTRLCHGCGSLQHFNQAGNLHHCCTSCGETWDQDANAARNLLARVAVVKVDGGQKDAASDDANGTIDGSSGMVASRESEGHGDDQVATAEVSKGGRWARRKATRSQSGLQSSPS